MITTSRATTFTQNMKSVIGLQQKLSNFHEKKSFVDYDWAFYDDLNKAIKFINEIFGSSRN
jgi:hypothetical protein